MTDDAGSVIWRMDYYPFGGERSVTGTGNDFTYEGHEKDAEIELWNNQARFFNEDGRFTAVDPLWTKYPALSPYVRVANNPLKYVDPTGKEIYDIKTGQIISDQEALTRTILIISDVLEGNTGTLDFSGRRSFYDLVNNVQHGHGFDAEVLYLGNARDLKSRQITVNSQYENKSVTYLSTRQVKNSKKSILEFNNKKGQAIVRLTGTIPELNAILVKSGYKLQASSDKENSYMLVKIELEEERE